MKAPSRSPLLWPGRKEQADDPPHGRPPDWQRPQRQAIQCQGWLDTKPAAAVENDEYEEFIRRILRAYSRRVADGDVEALSLRTGLANELDNAIAEAVKGLRSRGSRSTAIWYEGTAVPVACL